MQPLNIDFDRAEWRARRQGDDIDRRRRRTMQLAKREPKHLALLTDGHETRRPRRRRMRLGYLQRRTERVGIVGLDRRQCAETEAVEDGRGERNGLPQSGNVVARLGPHQHAHGSRAIGEGGAYRFEPDLRHGVDAERQHVCRQARAMARQCVDQLAAMVVVMQEQDRICSTGLAVGGHKRA